MVERSEDFDREIADKMYMKMNSSGEFTEEQIQLVRNALFVILPDYNIQKATHELIVYEGNINEQLLKKFLLCKKINGCTERTLLQYKHEIERAIKRMENKPCTDITVDDVRKLLAQETIKGNSLTQIDNVRRCLSTFFAWLEEEELIRRNPIRKIKKTRSRKVKKEAFTDMEVEMLRNACRDEKDIFLIEFLLSTGVRAFECVNIRLDEIEENKVLVHGKGQKDRYVYMNAKAQFALKNYLNERKDSNPYLFPRFVGVGKGVQTVGWWKNEKYVTDGSHVGHDCINTIVKSIGKKAGVKSKVHAHKFRRTCATFALRNGMPIEKVSKMLGHENVSTTQIYLDITESELERAHEKYVR